MKAQRVVEGEYMLDKVKNVITTKYFVGQTVYFLYQNKFKKDVVKEIRLNIGDNAKKVQYFFDLLGGMTPQGPVPFGAFEEDVFETKKDMVEAIMSL